MSGNYCFAETVFEIRFLSPEVSGFFRQFKVDEPAETVIEISEADVEKGFEAFLCKDKRWVEVLLIHKAVSTYLLEKDGFIFHSSTITVGGKAIVFTAQSGTGKSTHSRHWKECFPDEVEYVNDDKPFIRIKDDGVFVYGSPWNGKHRLGQNISAPVEYVCFLHRGDCERVEKISAYEAIPLFLTQTLGFSDTEKQLKLLNLLDRFLKSVKVCKIYCTDTTDSARNIRRLLEETFNEG